MRTTLRQQVDRAAARLFSANGTVCLERARLATEAWQAHAAEPAPPRALAFEHLPRHMTLDLASNPVFAGNTSTAPRAWLLIPEHGFDGDGQVALEHEELRGFPGHAVPDDLREFWRGRSFGGSGGLGHLLVDLDTVVHRGLEAVLVDLNRADDADSDQTRRTYRQAMRRSVLTVDTARHYAGGTNLNLTLTAAQATPALIDATVTAFFGAGGQEIQVNVLDAATLRDAQTAPERHGDLVVRVAGLCARFVELSATEQNELIARAEVVATDG